ncbi:MAG TPA: acyl carrier protein [Acetobacteraceae bacterium]|nr:acyl carrier protein [Acetobacteraceae bacterium]
MPGCQAADGPVLAQIADIVRDLLRDPELEVSEQSTPDDLPGWDSMTHIALIVESECRFGVQFRTGEIEDLHSVGDLVRSIRLKQIRAAT